MEIFDIGQGVKTILTKSSNFVQKKKEEHLQQVQAEKLSAQKEVFTKNANFATSVLSDLAHTYEDQKCAGIFSTRATALLDSTNFEKKFAVYRIPKIPNSVTPKNVCSDFNDFRNILIDNYCQKLEKLFFDFKNLGIISDCLCEERRQHLINLEMAQKNGHANRLPNINQKIIEIERSFEQYRMDAEKVQYEIMQISKKREILENIEVECISERDGDVFITIK